MIGHKTGIEPSFKVADKSTGVIELTTGVCGVTTTLSSLSSNEIEGCCKSFKCDWA